MSSLLLLFLALDPAHAATEPAKPSSHEVRQLEGWQVHVDARLLKPPQEAGFKGPLEILQRRLADVRLLLPASCVARLQQVPIWLDATHGKLKPAQYHPSAGWLSANGYNTALAKAVASKGKSKPTGKLAKALKKPKGTMALIGEGVKLDCISLGGYDLNDASYVSGQFRNGGCSAVSVLLDPEEGLGEDALVATVSEQQTARGEFPSPILVFVRGPLVEEVQLAAAAAGGAHGVVVPLALNGAEKTGALLEAAAAYGLEAIVRVCSAEELSTALDLSPAPTIVMFGDCTVQVR